MANDVTGEVLLEMRGLRIEGEADEVWHVIVNDVDLTLRRGEVIGLIGESGAGKSTIGIASMGYAKPGCRITGGEIFFDGMDLRKASDEELRKLRGARIAYVAQSAAASFNPAHKLIEQYCEMPVHVRGATCQRRVWPIKVGVSVRCTKSGAAERTRVCCGPI